MCIYIYIYIYTCIYIYIYTYHYYYYYYRRHANPKRDWHLFQQSPSVGMGQARCELINCSTACLRERHCVLPLMILQKTTLMATLVASRFGQGNVERCEHVLQRRNGTDPFTEKTRPQALATHSRAMVTLRGSNRLGIHQRGVQSEGGAEDGGSTI